MAYGRIDGSDWLKQLNDNFDVLELAELIELASNAETITGTDATKGVSPAGFIAALAALAHPIVTSSSIKATTAPVDHTHPAIGVGVYGTPVVETSLVDCIGFTVNMATATNKTDADTSSMAAFIGSSNTTDTPHVKVQGLLASATVHGDLFDAYAVQGHLTIHDAMATHDPNAHLTGLSGKALLSAAVEQGWVTGVLAIIDGAGAVTGLCHAIAGQVEAGVGANVCDAVLFLGADATVPTAIELSGVANMTAFLKVNAIGGCVIANALVPATDPGAGTVGADACLKVMVGATPYYIPMYDTLHG
jgi:hypothetical protein